MAHLISLFVAYAPADEAWLKKLDVSLASLKREGLIKTWDDSQIIAGQEWKQETEQRLESAQIILLLISSDFIASDICYDQQLQRAMQRHETGAAKVIPILLRPTDWESTPLSKLAPLPANGEFISRWPNQDDALLNVAQGLRQTVTALRTQGSLKNPEFLPANVSYALPNKKPASARKDRSEQILVDAVWAEVKDRLAQSLHNAVLITLDKAEQRYQVTRPWDSQIRIRDQASKPIPSGTHIAEVFDREDINGRLLILGKPGAGKTTTMLDLAAVLVQQANSDPNKPLPVILTLSSWKDDKQSFTDWLLHELKLKYGVSEKLGKQWLDSQALLPLLDGLDELKPHRQEPAVMKINHWLQSDNGVRQLLVCSRTEEYGLYTTNLMLNGALHLQPLNDEQLAAYFTSVKMEPLWNTVRQDSDLRELVRTPLLLSVSILANETIDLEQWAQLQSTQQRLSYLLDAYVQRQLHEPIKSQEYIHGKQPTAQQIRRWLIWLAQERKASSEDEFLIEKIQPTLLSNSQQRWLYRLCFGALLGLSTGSILGIISSVEFGVIDGFIFGLGVGMVVGLIGLFLSLTGDLDSIDAVEEFDLSISHFSLKDFFKKFFRIIQIGLVLGLTISFFYGLYKGLLLGVIFGVLAGLLYGIVHGFKSEIVHRLMPNQGIIRSAQNSLKLSIFAYPVSLLLTLAQQFVIKQSWDIAPSLVSAVATSLILGGIASGGGIACIQHFSLRLALYSAKLAPWNYRQFLNHCTERLLLQRVGGRYRFIHRLLQEHFAAMPLAKVRS